MNPAPLFTEIDFYDSKIRMCIIDDTKMYLVSDLLRQYNEKHGTNKRFKKYLENKQTQYLLRKQCEKTGGRNSDLQGKEGQNEHSTENEAILVRENSHELKIEAISAEDEQNEQITIASNSVLRSEEGQIGVFIIEKVFTFR